MGGALTVPYPFDVIIDGQGYVFADTEEQKAAFGLTPVFVPRQNTQGDYGDNQQDFWLTFTQKDWNKGEQQRYQGRDEDGKARYFLGTSVDVSTPGQVSMRKAFTTLSFAANPVTAFGHPGGNDVWVATSTNLYHVAYDGTITGDGAHGLGAAPSRWGMTDDGSGVYMSTTAGGVTLVRKWNGASFSSFSTTTGSDALAYLNNTLYGYRESAATLVRYDTGGTATVIYTWQGSSGTALTGVGSKLLAFGGKLLILRYRAGGGRGAELWLYDGTAPAKITEFPANFNAYDVEILNGTVFVSGSFEKHVGATLYQRGAIYAYKDGSQDILWQAQDYVAATTELPSLAVWEGGLIWHDPFWDQIVFYNPTTGGTSSLPSVSTIVSPWILQAAATFFLHASTGSTAGRLYPDATTVTSSHLYSSLIDFDSSLRKVVRGIRVEFEAATDGDGGSVDLAYRFDNINTGLTYTSLQTGAVSGTEYLIASPAEGTTYHSISVRVILNKGTSTDGPILKRVQVRAVPVTTAFKKRQYVLFLGGRDGESHITLRDGTTHALDGLQMAANLQTAASRTSPFTITDHLSTSGFTGVIENIEMREFKPEEFIAVVTVRQV